MDDDSDNPEGRGRAAAPPRARVSLVERAAGRIVSDSARPRGKAAPSPADDVDALPVNDPAPEVIEQRSEDWPDSIVEPARAPEPASQGTVQEADGAGASVRKRKTRKVQLDFPALESRYIITPRTKRNRTVEEFRLIKRMVLSRRWDENELPGNAIVVTSSLPSEGKTTTAINLAMSIAAEEDVRVLLIDADFIKPDALRQLGVKANKGLIDVLEDPRMDISDVILRTDIEKLSLIPAGRLHDRCTELLASARMDTLIAELATRYEDRILIFDSPPLLATTESVVLSSHMGQVVFVVQAGRTKRESVNSALELLGERQHLGLVLNRTKARFGSSGFGSYYYGYGYDYGSDAKKDERAGE